MAYCNREPSPVLRRKEKDRCMELLLDEDKIHRILLRSPAICRLANIESPNCIWFKLVNHISDDLRVVRPAKLEPLLPKSKKPEINKDDVTLNSPVFSSTLPSNNGLNITTNTENPDGVLVPEEETFQLQKPRSIQLYDYVLAPLEANVYARARIIHLKKILYQTDQDRQLERLFAYVHFIDEGFGVWLNTKCLAKMDPGMYTHPWQTFAVSMFRVRLGNELNGSSSNSLPSSLTDTLIDIMSNYEYFKVVPVIDSRRYPDYFEYTRAEIYGLETLEDDEGPEGKAESITHRLLIELLDTGQENNFEDLSKQNINGKIEKLSLNEANSSSDPLILDKSFDRVIFDAKQHPLVREKNFYWTPDLLAEIPKWRMKWPKDFCHDSLIVNGESLQQSLNISDIN
uniref:Uncharacterized protein n=1 Tax=Meloidogyne enterolobii TaxID=390850 RepID=A0A6V7Y9D0_MELEN|nr:unnamed protein product [Meloidogyne enterolobii]